MSDLTLSSMLSSGNSYKVRLMLALEGRDWLCGAAPRLADIALYAYTHRAGSRGGFDMGRFPHLTAWCTRVTGLPGYVGLTDG